MHINEDIEAALNELKLTHPHMWVENVTIIGMDTAFVTVYLADGREAPKETLPNVVKAPKARTGSVLRNKPTQQ